MISRSTSAIRSRGQSIENSLMSSFARGWWASAEVTSESVYSSGRVFNSVTMTATGRSLMADS